MTPKREAQEKRKSTL